MASIHSSGYDAGWTYGTSPMLSARAPAPQQPPSESREYVDTVTISDEARAKNPAPVYKQRDENGDILPFYKWDRTSSHEYYKASFANYDNGSAQGKRHEQLMQDFYSGTGVFLFDKWTPEKMAACKTTENYIGELKNGDCRQVDLGALPGMAEGMQSWYEGTGTFNWGYEGVRNEDGYIAIANSDRARQAKSMWENTDFSNSEQKLTAYLNSAALTPQDFTFVDGTRLFVLQQHERADFLNIIDAALAEAGINIRASQLEYGFDAEGKYDLGAIGRDASEGQKRIQDVINNAIHTSKVSGNNQLYSYAMKVQQRNTY